MTRPARIAVVIPARNEEGLIRRCLLSVVTAADRLRAESHSEVDIVVVADGCRDGTADIARSFPRVVVLETGGGNVGAARAAGVRLAIERGAEWIANTDADSVVPPHWLIAQLDFADVGPDVVVGTVSPDFRDLSHAQIVAWIRSHGSGQAIGHVHGANLGFRVCSYLEAGGYRSIPEHEDNDLVRRLRSVATVVAVAEIDVLTSGRQVGRTDGGYARHLREELAL